MSLGTVLAITVGMIALVVAGLLVINHIDDRRQAKRRERMRKATPYVPPTNPRPNDFDQWGRM